MREVEIAPLGDAAIVVQLGRRIGAEAHRRVRQLAYYLEHHPFAGLVQYVPAFTTVTVYYDGMKLAAEHQDQSSSDHMPLPYPIMVRIMESILEKLEDLEFPEAKTVDIPVCYGGEFGPDLDDVARRNGLTPEEVVQIHTSVDYLVHMLGFAPGFAYLGGMSPRIAAPRRSTPRLAIPAGSVGIAGEQTGVYPMETPGGWQLIGRTPVRLFLPQASPPSLLAAGQVVRFYPISRQAFEHWGESEG